MWNLICFRLALWPTLRQKFMNFLTLFSLVEASSRYCRDSHNFLTFLTTRLQISWFLGNIILKRNVSWLNQNGNVYCCSIVPDNSPHVNAENCKLYNAVSKRVHDGFQGHSTYTFGKYLLEDDLRSSIFGTFVVKFLACLPLVGFSNI